MIGCGASSFSQQGPALKRYEALHEGAEIVACCDIDEERAKAFKDAFQIPHCFTDIETMLDEINPQAVCLNIPSGGIVAPACLILEKGFPLILQKPPGAAAEDTLRIIQAAKSNIARTAFNRRYMPLVQKLTSILDETQIMDISYRMLRVQRFGADFTGMAVCGIDLVRFIAKADYKQLDIRYKILARYAENVANYYLNGEMRSGAVVRLDFLPVSGMEAERLEINTHKGLFILELPIPDSGDCGRLVHMENKKPVYSVRGDELTGSEKSEEYILSGCYEANARFFDDVKNGKKDQNIESGLQPVDILSHLKRKVMQYNLMPNARPAFPALDQE